MVTIYNTTLSATSQRHFSDGLGGLLPLPGVTCPESLVKRKRLAQHISVPVAAAPGEVANMRRNIISTS